MRDLAGNLAEWVDSIFLTQQGKAQVSLSGWTLEKLLVLRGNAWGITPLGLECAFRTNAPPAYFHLSVGFRYAYDR